MDDTFNKSLNNMLHMFHLLPMYRRTSKLCFISHAPTKSILNASPCALLPDFPIVLMPIKVNLITEQVE